MRIQLSWGLGQMYSVSQHHLFRQNMCHIFTQLIYVYIVRNRVQQFHPHSPGGAPAGIYILAVPANNQSPLSNDHVHLVICMALSFQNYCNTRKIYDYDGLYFPPVELMWQLFSSYIVHYDKEVVFMQTQLTSNRYVLSKSYTLFAFCQQCHTYIL